MQQDLYQLSVDPVLLVELQGAVELGGQLLLINVSVQVIHTVHCHNLHTGHLSDATEVTFQPLNLQTFAKP